MNPLIIKEFERMADETLKGSSPLERAIVIEQVIRVAVFLERNNPVGYPAYIYRTAFELLHKYYCMCEGLEKK